MITIPECVKQGYVITETDNWQIKPDAPQWAKDEFAELMEMLKAEPDENGIITLY